MNGLRAGMSAPPLMAAARVAAGVRAKSLRLPDLSRTAAVDPQETFLTGPAGEPRCRKADDEVPCDRAVKMRA